MYMHRDRDRPAVARRGGGWKVRRLRGGRLLDERLRRLGGHGRGLRLPLGREEAGPGLCGRPLLPAPLCRLEARDLVANRGEEPPALGEPALGRLPLRRLVGDDPLLRLPRPLELRLAADHGGAEALHLAQHAGVLRRDALDGVEAVQKILDRLRPQDHLEHPRVAASRVERDETVGEMRLRVHEAAARDRQMPRVRLQVLADPVELHVGEVVRLDRVRQLPVDLLGLGEDGLRLGLLPSIDGSAAAERERMSLPSAGTRAAPRWWGPGPSQVGHPSNRDGRPQRATEPKNSVKIASFTSHKRRTRG